MTDDSFLKNDGLIGYYIYIYIIKLFSFNFQKLSSVITVICHQKSDECHIMCTFLCNKCGFVGCKGKVLDFSRKKTRFCCVLSEKEVSLHILMSNT